VDVVDHAALFFDRAVDWLRSGRDFLEPIAKFFVGFLKTLPMTRAIAGDLAEEEAEGCGEDHPYGYEVCGLTTEEIARAFLVTPATLAQRIVRAKAKIRETPIPYEVPAPQELPERPDAVLQVIYLVFNEGYPAAAGAEVTRANRLRRSPLTISQWSGSQLAWAFPLGIL
jgi:hypothetical protein